MCTSSVYIFLPTPLFPPSLPSLPFHPLPPFLGYPHGNSYNCTENISFQTWRILKDRHGRYVYWRHCVRKIHSLQQGRLLFLDPSFYTNYKLINVTSDYTHPATFNHIDQLTRRSRRRRYGSQTIVWCWEQVMVIKNKQGYRWIRTTFLSFLCHQYSFWRPF